MKWEYKLTDFQLMKGVRRHEEALNELGVDGWEVISVWPDKKGDWDVMRVMLKRPVEKFRRKKDGKVAVGGRSYLFGPRTV